MSSVENNGNKISGMSWFSLVGLPSSFYSQIYENGSISSFFRSHNFENTATKFILSNKPMQVAVFNFYKTAVLQKNKGVVGYLNDSIDQGYGPGTHFLKVVKGLIEEYCRERGMEAVVEKEGVNLIVEVSGGQLPENFSGELRKLIYKNKDKFDFKSHNKTVNDLDVLGENNLKIKWGYTVIPANIHTSIDKVKGAIMSLYEIVKFNGWTGKAGLRDLLKIAEKNRIKVPVDVIYDSLDQNSISKDYFTHKDLFERSLKTLPDEYMPVLDSSLKKGAISRSTYEFLKMINMKFIDVKYGCLNEDGVHLAIEQALDHPEKAKSVIGITGADEFGGIVVMKDGRAYIYSGDINNLGGINPNYGPRAGDQFVKAHITGFDDVKEPVRTGTISSINDVFVELYRLINSKKINIVKSDISKEGAQFLKNVEINDHGDFIDTKIGDIKRTYAKDKKIVNKMVHKGASATVVVTGVIGYDRRRDRIRTEESMRNQVKKLKSSKAGKSGLLLIDIREYGAMHHYKSTLIKVDGDKQVVETRTVEIEPKGTVPVNEAKVPARPVLRSTVSLVPGPIAGGVSGLFAGAGTYTLGLALNGKLNEFDPGAFGKNILESGYHWGVFGGETIGVEKLAGFARGAVPLVITMDQLTGLALTPEGQKGRQAVVGGTGLGLFFAGMKAGSQVASKVPVPTPVKGAIALFGGILASGIGEKGLQELMDQNVLWVNDLAGNPVLEEVGQIVSPMGMALPGYWWQKEIEPNWQPSSTGGKIIKEATKTGVDVGGTVAAGWVLKNTLAYGVPRAATALNALEVKLPQLVGSGLKIAGEAGSAAIAAPAFVLTFVTPLGPSNPEPPSEDRLDLVKFQSDVANAYPKLIDEKFKEEMKDERFGPATKIWIKTIHEWNAHLDMNKYEFPLKEEFRPKPSYTK